MLALAFLGISLISAVNVWHWPGYWAGIWGLVIAPLIFYTAVRILVTSPGERQAVAMSLGIGGALAAGIGLIGWASGGGVDVDGVRRLIGLTFSPNQTALYLIRAIFVLIGLALMHDRVSSPSGKGSSRVAQAGPSADPFPEGSHQGHRSLLWSAVGVVALAILLTGSRGALSDRPRSRQRGGNSSISTKFDEVGCTHALVEPGARVTRPPPASTCLQNASTSSHS